MQACTYEQHYVVSYISCNLDFSYICIYTYIFVFVWAYVYMCVLKALNTLFYLGPDHHSKFWTSQIFIVHVAKI